MIKLKMIYQNIKMHYIWFVNRCNIIHNDSSNANAVVTEKQFRGAEPFYISYCIMIISITVLLSLS